MIEALVKVERISKGLIWVVPVESASGCGRCHEPGGCGAGRLNQDRIGRRIFSVPENADLEVGDRVWVRINKGALWRAALAAYVFSTVLVIAGGGIGLLVRPDDLFVAFGAVLGLIVSLCVNFLLTRSARWRTGLRVEFVKDEHGCVKKWGDHSQCLPEC